MNTSTTFPSSLRALARTATVAATLTGVLAATAVGATTASADAAGLSEFKRPKVYGTSFQSDPHHDFTRRIHSRHDGILRGWIVYYDAGTAEYTPIKWKKGKHSAGHFVGPDEGNVTAYASPVSSKVAFYSATNCNGRKITMNNAGLGTKRCSREAFIAKLKKDSHQPALITVHKGRIIKFQEIYTP